MSTKSVNVEERDGGKGLVVIEGYLKKLKTMKKKYFVVRGESTEASARLEYYDSEKKYRSGQRPKRMISLKTCFNINKRTDTKHKYVIALYTKDDVFCVVLDTEQQQEEWLRLLLALQSGDDNVDGENLRPIFEHMWKVTLQPKGLGDSRNLVGPSYVCLSDQTLSIIVCGNNDKREEVLEFPLTQIRRCGGSLAFFYIEVGRQSVTGDGELWMLTGDPYISKNMDEVISSAFTQRQKDHNADPHRKRSSSATEASRPVGLYLSRRTTLSGPKTITPYSGSYGFDLEESQNEAVCSGLKISSSPLRPNEAHSQSAVPVTSCLGPHSLARVSAVSRPASQRRHSVSAVSSSAAHPVCADVPDGGAATNASPGVPPCTVISHQRTKSCPVSDPVPLIVEPHRYLSHTHVDSPCPDRRGSGGMGLRRAPLPKSTTGPRERSDSMPSRNRTSSETTHKSYVRPQSVHMRGVSDSPPGPCSTDSAGSSLSIDEPDFERFPHSAVADDRIILEENADEALNWRNDPELEAERLDVYVPMVRPPTSLSLPINAPRKISAPGVLQGSPSDYLTMSPGDSVRRVRHESSPSSADYLPMSPGESNPKRVPPGSSPASSDYLPMSPADRRIISGSSPAASSDYLTMSPRDLNRRRQVVSLDNLPLSPEESLRRAVTSSSPSGSSDYLLMSPSSATNRISPADSLVPRPSSTAQNTLQAKRGFLAMETTPTPSLTGTSPSATNDYLLMSLTDTTHGTSPSSSDYLLMSPAGSGRNIAALGSSPSTASDYMPMSPGENNNRHLLTTSGESVQRAHSRGSSLAEDGYVPMAPHHSDDGYVDMDPLPAHRFLHDDHHSDMSPGSSCSVTSGTPSTDHYLLEKVSAYFTPSEEEEGSCTDRPARTYSFGSQPKGRLDVANAAEAARVRAFSVGTKPRPETHKLSKRTAPPGVKFSSAPLLSSSWSGSSRLPPHDPMADHMEIDFTRKRTSRFKALPVMENITAQNTSSADSGYMDMSSKSPPRASPPKPPSSKHLFSPPDVAKSALSARLIKPAIISSSTLKTIGEKPDIKPQKFPTTSSANINILPSKVHAPERPYVEMKGRANRSGSESKVEGYMDMSFGGSAAKLTRKGSADSVRDYMSMSCGKCSSQPIAIRGPASPTSRKTSSTTPPKPPSFLSLGGSTGTFNPFSSIRRNPKRKGRKKQERRDSKENETTPTAIFPLSLNSPLSPKKSYPSESEGASTEEIPEEVESSNLAVPLSRVLRLCSKENSPAGETISVTAAEAEPSCSEPQRKASAPKCADDSQPRCPAAGRPPSSPRPPEKPPEADSLPRLAPLAKPEDARLKSDSSGNESHSGVIRQVSTSSSSSTEVMSVKEGAGRDITYASLDLGSEGEEPRSPRPSPTPTSSQGPFAYAEIDFQKSESLRAPKSYNKKIRH